MFERATGVSRGYGRRHGGIVEVTLQCVPAFLLRAVEHPEPFDEVLDTFEQRAVESDHFEFYWWPHTDAVMTKNNTRLPLDALGKKVGPVSNWVEETLMSNWVLALKSGLGTALPRKGALHRADRGFLKRVDLFLLEPVADSDAAELDGVGGFHRAPVLTTSR